MANETDLSLWTSCGHLIVTLWWNQARFCSVAKGRGRLHLVRAIHTPIIQTLWIWQRPWVWWPDGTSVLGRQIYFVRGWFYPDRMDPENSTKPMNLTGRFYPVRADLPRSDGTDEFSRDELYPDRMCDRTEPMNLGTGWNWWIYESDGTDELTKRTEPMKMDGQIVPRPGQMFPRSEGTDG